MNTFDESKDYYAVLKLSSSATADEITRAYKTLASKYHPDRHQGNELEDLALEKLEQLNEAYRVLGNSKTRLNYDSLRRTQNSREQYRSSCHCAPSAPPPGSGVLLAKILKWLLLAALLWTAIRVVRTPRTAVIAAAITITVWFGPLILKAFKSKK